MQSSHPLGEDFARWVELTDTLRAQLAQASVEKAPVSRELAHTANRVKEMAKSPRFWDPGSGRPH